MNQPLASSGDNPYGQRAAMMGQVEEEHPALNWAKLIFLILLTYGLIVSMWEIWYSFNYSALQSKLCMIIVCHLPMSMEEDSCSVCFVSMCFASEWHGISDRRRGKI